MHDTIRAFIAFDLPEDIISAIIPIQDRLKKYPLGIRYTLPKSIHLTLRFLGDIPIQSVDSIIPVIEKSIESESSLSLSMKGMGAFPSYKRPRVLWLGLSGEIDRLRSVQKRINENLEGEGLPSDSKPFKAHLTLGRIKGRVDAREFMRALENEGGYPAKAFKANVVTLYRSQLRPNGPIYTPIKSILLSGKQNTSALAD